jgi:hypothetical protein
MTVPASVLPWWSQGDPLVLWQPGVAMVTLLQL